MGTVKHWSRIAESHSDPQLKSSRRSATSALQHTALDRGTRVLSVIKSGASDR